jgi:exopolysaccharide production protein ExoZ
MSGESETLAATSLRPTRLIKFESIDILRGLAAFVVVLSHAQEAYWRNGPLIWDGQASEFFATQSLLDAFLYMFRYGGLGVPLFFVISGFCIHLPYAGGRKRMNAREFTIRRMLRLYPLYLAVVLAGFALVGMKYGYGIGEVTWRNFVGHLFFWYYFTDPASPGMGITPLLWTIAIEVHFYVLYVLFLPLLRRFGFAKIVILALTIDVAYRLVFLILHLEEAGWPRYMQPHRFAVTRFGEWLLGAWIAEAFVRDGMRRVPAAIATLGRASAIGLTFVASGVVLAYFVAYDDFVWDIPAVLGFSIVLIGALHSEAARGAVWAASRKWYAWACWLGTRSYSLYLTHLLVITVITEAFSRIMKIDKDAMGGTWGLLAVAGVGIVASVIVAHIAYHLIEAPSHALGRRLADRVAVRERTVPTAA